MGKKLPKMTRVEIYNTYVNENLTQIQIADMYDVSQATVSNIIREFEVIDTNYSKLNFQFNECNVIILNATLTKERSYIEQ